MRDLLLIAAFLVAVPDRPDPVPKEKVKPVAEQIVGEWQLLEGVIGGKNPPVPIDMTVLVFSKTEVQVREGGNAKNQEDATYTIDASKKPVTIDIVPKQGGNKKIEGILKLEGDRLTLCFAHGGDGQRPTEFASPPNSRVALLQLKRVKK